MNIQDPTTNQKLRLVCHLELKRKGLVVWGFKGQEGNSHENEKNL